MKKLLIIILAACSILSAQEEFLVNTYLDSTQRAPVISGNSQGSYIIVWQSINQFRNDSGSDIYWRMFGTEDQSIGEELFVNIHPEGTQERPSLAMNDESNFVIVWASSTGNAEDMFEIRVHYYLGLDVIVPQFQVNNTNLYSQTKPDVDINNDNQSVIVWESWYQDGSNKGVYARIFNELGEPVTDEFLVNTTTQFSQGRPKVKFLNNSNFVVIWESWKQDIVTPSGYGLYGKIYNGSGEVVKDEFRINTYTNDYQWFGDIAVTNDGGFVTTWCSWKQDGSDGGIFIRKYDEAGNELGNEVQVNKTTVKYQWLPRVNEMPDGKIGVVWSSWQQDGSREGVYAKLLYPDLSSATFETQVNDYTDSYQWEPDFIPTGIDEMVVTWSSWGQYDNDYEIMAKRISLTGPEGVIGSKTYAHSGGRSTSRFYVHVMDSTQLSGDEYELSFSSVSDGTALADLKNISTGESVVAGYPLDKGEGIFYITPEFDGAAVEIQPNFTFAIDDDRSYFANNSGTNLSFAVGAGFGSIKLAPIDIAIIWGNTDTLADGSYAEPLDTAYNSTGTKLVECPFYAWNMRDREKMDLVILEPSSSANLKWDYTEDVGFLTPPQYEPNFPQYHASLVVNSSGSNIVMPSAGDTNFIFTKRPLTTEDKFVFKTDKAFITTDITESELTPNKFRLFQNYPNPFNPTTTIEYSIPLGNENFRSQQTVKLRIFDILGREVATLVNEQQKPGRYKVMFDASSLSTGVYFYNIRYGDKSISRKMILVK